AHDRRHWRRRRRRVAMAGTGEITSPGRGERGLQVAIVLAALIWSGIAPNDRLTWVLEVTWVAIGLPLVWWCWRRFPLSRLLCWLLVGHAVGLVYGGKYTYAEPPIGDWFRQAFELERNHYDRLGHFLQGFVPAILARELLLRQTPLRRGGWLFYLVVAACLS